MSAGDDSQDCQTRPSPLKRFLQRRLETRIGRAPIANDSPDGSIMLAEVQGDELKAKTQMKN